MGSEQSKESDTKKVEVSPQPETLRVQTVKSFQSQPKEENVNEDIKKAQPVIEKEAHSALKDLSNSQQKEKDDKGKKKSLLQVQELADDDEELGISGKKEKRFRPSQMKASESIS